MKVVYITGVTGFLGSHVARALVEHEFEVHGLVRAISNKARIADIADRMVFHDVDRSPVRELFAGSPPPDAILHLATTYGQKGEAPSELALANTVFPLTLLQHAVREGVPKFLNASTCYTLEYKHLQSYTLSKQHLTDWGRILATPKTRFIDLKLFHPYGPADGSNKFVPYIIKTCLESTGDVPLTAGEQRKDFIHVRDVVSAIELLLAGPEQWESAFVSLECGSGHAISIRELVEMVHRMTRSKASLRFGALPYRENEMMFSQANPSALRAMGWRPQVSLEQGIADVIRKDFGDPV